MAIYLLICGFSGAIVGLDTFYHEVYGFSICFIWGQLLMGEVSWEQAWALYDSGLADTDLWLEIWSDELRGNLEHKVKLDEEILQETTPKYSATDDKNLNR